MALGHDAGGARIKFSRKKIFSTTTAWPQCAQTKVGANAAESIASKLLGRWQWSCRVRQRARQRQVVPPVAVC